MNRYSKYKNNKTVEKKVLSKYGLGGILGDIGKITADTGLSALGMDNIIKDDMYSNKGFAKASNIAGQIGKTALPIAANIFAPGIGGAIAGGVQSLGSSFNPVEEVEQKNIQSGVSPVRTLKCGGKLKRYQNGGELTEFNGLKHEQGGLPLGSIAEVEDGETRYSDFIFSDSINYDNKKTFAEIKR